MKIPANPANKTEELEWIVDNRSRNQLASIKLYKLLEHHRGKIDENRRYRAFFQVLIGINFSLWRAVFLSDLEQKHGSMLKRGEEFLEELIRNNAINYPQDRKYRDYSFRYYIQNARSRLKGLENSFAYYNLSFNVPGSSKGITPRQLWVMHQESSEEATDSLNAILQQAKPARRKKISK